MRFSTVVPMLVALVSVPLTTAAMECSDPVWIPDVGLREAIASTLRVHPDAIGCEHMKRLTTLQANQAEITDLEGLQYATRLQSLTLIENSIPNLDPLAWCTELRSLHLFNNEIEDIGGLARLPKLEKLTLRTNRLDSEDLYQLPSSTLRYLDISNNSITDITALASLGKLSFLAVGNCGLSDLRPAARLPRLRELRAGQNPITAIPRFASPRLEVVHLPYCEIDDISALAAQPSLRELYLRKNLISNLDALASLAGLKHLDMGENRIRQLSPLDHHPGLPPGAVLLLDRNRIDMDEDSPSRRVLQQLGERGVRITAVPQRQRP